MRILFLVALVLCIGCDSEDKKKNRAKSQVESIAEQWEEGKDISKTVFDPWGNKIIIKYEDDLIYLKSVTVTSSGPDLLPFTYDDIKATRIKRQ